MILILFHRYRRRFLDRFFLFYQYLPVSYRMHVVKLNNVKKLMESKGLPIQSLV